MPRPITRATFSNPSDDDVLPTDSSSTSTDQHLDSILSILARPDPRLVEILERMEQHLDDRLTNIERDYQNYQLLSIT